MIDQNSPELIRFIAGASAIKEAHRVRNGLTVYSSSYVKVKTVGPKFIKLQALEVHAASGYIQKSGIFAFIDRTTGDVFKAATASAPAKGARGNLFDAAGGLARITPYGPEYNK